MESPQQHSKSDTQTFYCMVSRTAARLLSETKQRSLKTFFIPGSGLKLQKIRPQFAALSATGSDERCDQSVQVEVPGYAGVVGSFEP